MSVQKIYEMLKVSGYLLYRCELSVKYFIELSVGTNSFLSCQDLF